MDGVVPIQRQVEIDKDEKLEEVIFKELQKALRDKPDSTIPQGTKLLSVEVKESICYLDHLKNLWTTTLEALHLKQY